ncbi:hypothetical protein HYU21_00285 [Candidatus Woesearchaeota archaeon]|nr:hypothetical protein [Candidatus Woesearchaeota archaeon]
MLLKLSNPRKEHFQHWTTREILLQYCDKSRITIKDLENLASDGKVKLATHEQELEAVLSQDKKKYNVGNFETINRINGAKSEELVVLPSEYRFTAQDSRKAIAYKYSSLLPLNKFMGENNPASKVLEAGIRKLHSDRDNYVNRDIIGWSWFGQDKLLRVVPIMSSLKGLELRAVQNLAWYKHEFTEFAKEGKMFRDDLTLSLSLEDERKIKRWERYVRHLESPRREGHNLQYYVNLIDLNHGDIIQQETPFERERVMNFRTPSRSNTFAKYHFKMCNIPLESNVDKTNNSSVGKITVWDMYGKCYCLDKNYRSDRRGNAEEYYFCPHEVASLMGLKARLEEHGKGPRVNSLPFLIPTKSMIDFVDKLRYRTIMLDDDTETGKVKMRALNDTEIGMLAMKKLIAEPYEKNVIAEFDTFRKTKYDPLLDLVKFR